MRTNGGSGLLKRAWMVFAPLAGFGLLAALFLWKPLLTGQVLLPTDLAFRYDFVWSAQAEGRSPHQVAQNPLLADVSEYYYPYRVFALEALEAGRIPLWNPLILSGTPFFASAQMALLDPVNVLTLPAGPLSSWALGAWLRLTLLGWFTFGFARVLGRSAPAAAGAGVVFMICGFTVVWINYPIVTSLVWMPALFWAGTRLVETGERRFLAATALASGALLVGGHPETQFLVGLVWALYMVFLLAGLRDAGGAATGRLLHLTAAITLGAALGAVQWVPFVDLLSRSHAFAARAEAFPAFDATELVVRLAVLLLPDLGGRRAFEDYWLPGFPGVINFNEQTGNIGLLAVGLAVLGFAAARRAGGEDARRTLFFGVASLVAVALAIRAPGFHFWKLVPILDVGHGVRWVIVSSFFGALLAARGLDALRLASGGEAARRAGRVLGVASLLGLMVLGVAWLAVSALPPQEIFTVSMRGQATVVRAGLLAEVLGPGRVHAPLLVLLAGAGVLVALGRRALRPGPALATLVALLYLDLWLFGSTFNPVTPPEDIFPPTPTTRYLEAHLGRDRLVAAGDMLRPNVAMVFGFRDLRGYEDLVKDHFDALYGPTLARLSTQPRPRILPEDARLLDVAAVRYALLHESLRGDMRRLPYELAFEDAPVLAYVSRGALPRAHAVLSSRVVPDTDAARRLLLDPQFDVHREVVLVGDGEARAGPDVSVEPVVWLVDKPGEVVLEATLPAPGYVVLADVWAREWKATVGDRPAAVLRANGVFRAVSVPAGTHKVRFHYRPNLVIACAAVSAAAALAVAALLLTPRAAAAGGSREVEAS
jgi:hypothetical protein